MCLKKTEDHYFTGDGTGLGTLELPIALRLTSITGQQLETTLNQIQDTVTSLQYAGFSPGESPACFCPGGGGVLPYIGYTGIYRWKGYGFQAIYSGIESSNHRKVSDQSASADLKKHV